MAYKDNGIGNGSIYIGNVKWNNDYKNVMLFSSEAARNTWMKSNLKKVDNLNNVVYYNPEGYIDFQCSIDYLYTYNYIFYIPDTSIASKPLCLFLNSYEYVAPATTRCFVTMDVWQMYIYGMTAYQTYIERGIIKKSDDKINGNLVGEPFSPKLEYTKELTEIGSADEWNPHWVLHMTSNYNATTKKYEYSGIGTSNTFGEYGIFINSKSDINSMLELYGRKSMDDVVGGIDWNAILQSFLSGGTSTASVGALTSATSIADLQDHRDELIGVYAIPEWLYSAAGGTSKGHATNERKNKEVSLSINQSTLGNGYTPRNKKMLSSICRAYSLQNRTGTHVSFKPELFDDAPKITLSGITMETSGYQYYMSNYEDIDASFGDIAYASERRVGYDANTGLNKINSIISTTSSAIGSVASLAGGIATENPVEIAQGLTSVASTGVNAVDQLGQQGVSIGSNASLLKITGGRAALKWYEISPNVDECKAIDNFFDMYGYAIHKHQSINSYMNNRSNWDYVQTRNANLRIQAPNDYENKMKDIFNAGVTIWHTYTDFGDYSKENS